MTRTKLLLAVHIAFLLSGFPAIVYQIVWQRALFNIVGVNVESVATIVTAFMLGIGLGGALGGWLTRIGRVPDLLAFAVLEASIGVFAQFSLQFFRGLEAVTLSSGPAVSWCLAFVTILIPTLLLGATLPILVNWLTDRFGNVGQSVGSLYFVNTLGSAGGCFLAAFALLPALGMQQTINLASMVNLLIAVAAILVIQLDRYSGERGGETEDERQSSASVSPRTVLLVLLFFTSGFLALSYEILWFRVLSFAAKSRAPAFALMLGAYLGGLAFGSLGASLLCRRMARESIVRALLAVCVLMAVVGYAVIPAIVDGIGAGLGYQAAVLFVAPATAVMGMVFPLLCHVAISNRALVGLKVGAFYLVNIIGSAAGSLFTGYVLLELLTTQQISVTLLVAGGGLALVVGVGLMERRRRTAWLTRSAVVVLVVAVAYVLLDGRYRDVYRRLLRGVDGKPIPAAAVQEVVEADFGVILITDDKRAYSGGVYDGQISVDLIDDTNMIVRPYSLSLFHASPKRVLMIGLGTGAWAQVVANNPHVEELVVVEINEGFLEIIERHDEVKSLLASPVVSIEIDDGRRWLQRNQDERFDAIVMNTTHHWRNQMSRMMSVEFLELARQRLATGGVLFFNTTDGFRCYKSALEVFGHVARVLNFALCSDEPLVFDGERWIQTLLEYRIDGAPVLDPARPDHRRRIEELRALARPRDGALGRHVESEDSVRRNYDGFSAITDDNMGYEWRHGKPGARPVSK